MSEWFFCVQFFPRKNSFMTQNKASNVLIFMATVNEIVWRKCCVHTKLGKIIADSLIDNFLFAFLNLCFGFDCVLVHGFQWNAVALLIIINYFEITLWISFIRERIKVSQMHQKKKNRRKRKNSLSQSPQEKNRNKTIFSCNCLSVRIKNKF